MSLTSIGDQRTPGRPIEITFAPELGIPSANQEVLLMGRAASSTPASAINKVLVVSNSSDSDLARTEMIAKGFPASSEITKMVLAAIDANAKVGASTFPALKVIAMQSTESGFGSGDEILKTVEKNKAEFIVSPYGANDQTNTNKVKNSARLMSGATRCDNNQFGTFGVVVDRATTDPSTLFAYDTLNLFPIWLPDTGTGQNAPAYSIAEIAAACAARAASNTIPFNPMDDITIGGVDAPKIAADFITKGPGLQSEVALGKGYTPLYVKPNGEVAFVRTVTARLSLDGTGAPVVGAYYDLQDHQVLFFWRKTCWTRANQPDFKRRKASQEAAIAYRGELVRLAKVFEQQNMFQAVDQLAKKFRVERSLSDRHRFDVKTPVNVIPGLHVIAQNIEASTEFDTFSV